MLISRLTYHGRYTNSRGGSTQIQRHFSSFVLLQHPPHRESKTLIEYLYKHRWYCCKIGTAQIEKMQLIME